MAASLPTSVAHVQHILHTVTYRYLRDTVIYRYVLDTVTYRYLLLLADSLAGGARALQRASLPDAARGALQCV